MKRTRKQPDEMLPHYDFSNGVRGKHAKKYRDGVTVELLGDKKSHFVALDDDVRKVFPDAKSVNHALRHLAEAMPKKSRTR